MSNYLLYFFIFLFGLITGSFLNCIIYRLQTGGSFLKGRSFCPHCRHELSWQDLIPVLSFFILRGKCRYCKKTISWQYPLVELATGFLFLFPLLNIYTMVDLLRVVFWWVICCFLIVIFVYDLKHYIIPDKVICPAIFIALIYQLFINWKLAAGNLQPLLNPLLSAILASAFFLAIVLISRGKWMGVGDIKLAAFMSLFLGFPNILVALFLAFFIGAIIGLGLIFSGKRTLNSEVPFGPFLVLGTFIAFFWGSQINNWYFSLFL